MDNLFDMDMALDMSEYFNNDIITVSSSGTKKSESSEKEESEDIYTSIMLMPTLQMSDDELGSVCTVCMEGFKCGEGKIIPCGHVYHPTCIAKWLSLYSSCPVCRSIVSGDMMNNFISNHC